MTGISLEIATERQVPELIKKLSPTPMFVTGKNVSSFTAICGHRHSGKNQKSDIRLLLILPSIRNLILILE